MGEVVNAAPWEVLVPEDAKGSPFAGMTVGQAELLNSAMFGLPVMVAGGHGPAPHVYVFRAIMVPGSLTNSPLACVGDLLLWRARQDAGCWVPMVGSMRVLSAVLVRRFVALDWRAQYRVCTQCGARVPRTEKIYLGYGYDVGGLGDYRQGFECARCWGGR